MPRQATRWNATIRGLATPRGHGQPQPRSGPSAPRSTAGQHGREGLCGGQVATTRTYAKFDWGFAGDSPWSPNVARNEVARRHPASTRRTVGEELKEDAVASILFQ